VVTPLPDLPDSVAKNGLTGNTVYTFKEFEGTVTDLPLDIGETSISGDVCSYYMHLDVGSDLAAWLDGSLTFEKDIAGLIVAGSSHLRPSE
jgi:hypothetical protein